MNKSTIKHLEGKKLTWAFVEFRTGIFYGLCVYDEDGIPLLAEKLDWEQAYNIESRYGLDIDNSMIKFSTEIDKLKMKGKNILDAKLKYKVMQKKEFNKLKKYILPSDIKIEF